MRLVFLYHQTRDPNLHAQFVQEEGFYRIFEHLLDSGIISHLLIILEGGYDEVISSTDRITIRVIPGMDNLDCLLEPNDIVLCRNGFRSWFNLLNRLNDKKIWLMFYRAASNRHFWKMWDIVLEDIDPRISNGVFVDEHDRMYLPIIKPVHPNIFYPTNEPRIYDMCLGASHIHYKKGQFREAMAAVEAQKVLGKKLKCVMPGRFVKRSMRDEMYKIAEEGNLDITYPGMISRVELAKIFNQSSIYLHLATCGQNDRGVLEAMACGTPAMIGYPQFHPPYMTDGRSLIWWAKDAEDAVKTGEFIASFYNCATRLGQDYRNVIRTYYLEQNGMREQALPIFEKLFTYLKQNPVVDRPKLWEHYGTRREN